MSRLVRWRIRRRKVRRAGLLHGWLSLPHGDSRPPTLAPESVEPGVAAAGGSASGSPARSITPQNSVLVRASPC